MTPHCRRNDHFFLLLYYYYIRFPTKVDSSDKKTEINNPFFLLHTHTTHTHTIYSLNAYILLGERTKKTVEEKIIEKYTRYICHFLYCVINILYLPYTEGGFTYRRNGQFPNRPLCFYGTSSILHSLK